MWQLFPIRRLSVVFLFVAPIVVYLIIGSFERAFSVIRQALKRKKWTDGRFSAEVGFGRRLTFRATGAHQRMYFTGLS
jgi:hypothetical protein